MNFINQHDYSQPKLMKSGQLVIVYEKHDGLDHFY